MGTILIPGMDFSMYPFYVKNAWNRVMLKINFRFGKGKQYQEPVRKTVEEGL